MRIKIKGLVQGVGFRYFVYFNAVKLGVNGFVRNTRDGDVEAVFEGEASRVEDLVSICGKGPSAAIVESLDRAYETFSGEFRGFRISR